MTASKPRQALNLLLCLSLLGGSTSASIQHSHEQGRIPHTHGFGLVSWIASPTIPIRSSAGETDAFASRHSHCFLLGMELYGGECPFHCPPTRSPKSQDETTLAFGIESGVADELVLSDFSRPIISFLGLTSLYTTDLAFSPLSILDKSLQTLPIACSLLCDRARGERSGVRLI